MRCQPGTLRWLVVTASLMGFMTFYHRYQIAKLSESSPSLRRDDPASAPGSGLVFIAHSDASITVDPRLTLRENDVNFFKFMSKRHYACEKSDRFGNALDGGWDMCLTEPYLPKGPCLVYSFGINNDFTFDDAISARFNCTVRCFDPSMNVKDHKRSDNIWFYRLGIGGEDTVNKYNWTMRTLPSILKMMNESNSLIDYLKIDVEDSEWTALPPIFSSGVLSKVKQFGLEIHFFGAHTGERLTEKFKVLKGIEDFGFRRWYFNVNQYHLARTDRGFRSCCYEMVYINTKFLKP